MLDEITNRLGANGFATCRVASTSNEFLAGLAGRLGPLQSHPLADRHGVVDVTVSDKHQIEMSPVSKVGLSGEEFPLHTDGSFLGRAPTHFLLLCVQPAAKGGDNILVDTRPILESFRGNQPSYFELLTRPDAIDFRAPNLPALEAPLFEALSRGCFRIRFRLDVMHPKPWARQAFEHFVADYLSLPEHRQTVRLAARELLVVDNFRFLHGRNGFANRPENNQRHLKRVWIWNNDSKAIPARGYGLVA